MPKKYESSQSKNVVQLKSSMKVEIDIIKQCLRELLQEHGVLPLQYKERMSTSEVAEKLGCSVITVRRNWKSMPLQCLGRNLKRELVFSGVSVKRYIEMRNYHV